MLVIPATGRFIQNDSSFQSIKKCWREATLTFNQSKQCWREATLAFDQSKSADAKRLYLSANGKVLTRSDANFQPIKKCWRDASFQPITKCWPETTL